MKTLLLSLFLVQSSMAQTIAQTSRNSGLPELQEGKVTYFVSHSNRLIHLEMPYRVKFVLMELDHVQDAAYSLSVSGEWESNVKRPEIQKIKALYPGYEFSGQSMSSWVKTCAITLKNGRSLYCDIPPANGNYFSALELLSRSEGDQLKEALKKGEYPSLQVSLSLQEPFVESIERASVATQGLYDALPKIGEVEVKQLVKPVAKTLATSGITTDSPFYDQAVEELMKSCLDEKPEVNAHTLSDLLSTRLRVKKPSTDFIRFQREKLGWSQKNKAAQFDFSVEFVEGK